MEIVRNIALCVFALWLLVDGMVVFGRKSGKPEDRDRFSLRLIVAGNLVGSAVSIWLAFHASGALLTGVVVQVAGLVIFGIGIAIRSIAIVQLGRFHTPNVAVLADHEVIDHGLYRNVRHPSYLGALIAFFGFGLALGNWLSLLVIALLTPPVYLFRIREEEAALAAALGKSYESYRCRTWRLIPHVF